MLEIEILVLKRFAINGSFACAVRFEEVASLDHKIFADTMEDTAFVSLRLSFHLHFPCAELSGSRSDLSRPLCDGESGWSPKVLCCARNNICKQFHLDSANGLSSDADIEEHDGVILAHFVAFRHDTN